MLLRASRHEKLTGHSVREHVFCNQCHRRVALGVKIQGEYYWSSLIVRKDHSIQVERVIYERSLSLLANQAR